MFIYVLFHCFIFTLLSSFSSSSSPQFERQEDVKGQLDAANNQIKKLQETVDVLHADIEVYEKDISDLQKQIKLLKRGGTGVNTGGSATPLGQNPSVATPALQVAIDNLGATGLPSVGPSPLGSPKHRSQQYDSSGSGATAPASIIVKYETQVRIRKKKNKSNYKI